jgi:hypothetical protein
MGNGKGHQAKHAKSCEERRAGIHGADGQQHAWRWSGRGHAGRAVPVIRRAIRCSDPASSLRAQAGTSR